MDPPVRKENMVILGKILIFLGFVFFLFLPGCGNKKTDMVSNSSVNVKTENFSFGKIDRKTSRKPEKISQDPAVLAYEAAKKKNLEITAALEEASKMIKSSNLEGALRKVQQIHQENSRDPYVTMQTWYMQAMIYHRQKEPGKRKEAMNQMLKSMEALQKDSRFRTAFEEGQASIEVIKKSIEKAGPRYEKQ